MKRNIILLIILSALFLSACGSSKSDPVVDNFKNSVSDTLDAFGHLDKYEISNDKVTVYFEKEYDNLSENAKVGYVNKVCDRVLKAANDTGAFDKWKRIYVNVHSSDGTYLDTYLVENE